MSYIIYKKKGQKVPILTTDKKFQKLEKEFEMFNESLIMIHYSTSLERLIQVCQIEQLKIQL
jgi:hypothetical protein